MAELITGVFKSAGRGRDSRRGHYRRDDHGGPGVLLDAGRSFRRGSDEVRVPGGLVTEFGLIDGATVVGSLRASSRRRELAAVETVCGLAPDQYQARKRFVDLVAIDPCVRFNLAASGDTSARIVDLVAPLGKGSRSLIVSPAKAGKTTLLEKIANGILADNPATRIVVLLIDERPEEVTHFRRAVNAEVLASTNDESAEQHVALAELTLAHVRVELECDRDVVVMVDSLTRMGRAFNLRGSGTRRTMSGGVEAGALEIPRRFFGLARNIENGGSVTIIATALIDTGSRMDQVILEEFKGTGNSEVVLSRELAEARVFPAIDILASGTRREERLYGPDDMLRLANLRRFLVQHKPARAMASLLKVLDEFPSNEDVLRHLPTGR